MATQPPPAVQEFLASLTGRYQELQDGYTVSGTGSRRFSNYLYSRKLLIRKSIQDEPGRHHIYCTHCTRLPWKVAAKFTTTSAQLRHFRHHHPRLPITQEEENAKIQELTSSGSSGNIAAVTPFALAVQASSMRTVSARFDHKV